MNQQILPPGTRLAEIYEIESLLGSGGFAKTYLARDLTLARMVAIKEFFPATLATRNGLDVQPFATNSKKSFEDARVRFEKEARTLARISHPNIVRIYRTFDANSTSYIVLEYLEGRDLEDWLETRGGRLLSQSELDNLISPLLDALEAVHEAGVLHRDVTPRNIRVRSDDNVPILIDFGAARAVLGTGPRTTVAIKTPHYAPLESNSSDSTLLGPWTDIYGLAATIYRALSGLPPVEATERILQDTLVPATRLRLSAGDYSSRFLEAVDWALMIRPEERPQSIAAWRARLIDDRAEPAEAALPNRPEAEDDGPQLTIAPTSAEPASAEPTSAQPATATPVKIQRPEGRRQVGEAAGWLLIAASAIGLFFWQFSPESMKLDFVWRLFGERTTDVANLEKPDTTAEKAAPSAPKSGISVPEQQVPPTTLDKQKPSSKAKEPPMAAPTPTEKAPPEEKEKSSSLDENKSTVAPTAPPEPAPNLPGTTAPSPPTDAMPPTPGTPQPSPGEASPAPPKDLAPPPSANPKDASTGEQTQAPPPVASPTPPAEASPAPPPPPPPPPPEPKKPARKLVQRDVWHVVVKEPDGVPITNGVVNEDATRFVLGLADRKVSLWKAEGDTVTAQSSASTGFIFSIASLWGTLQEDSPLVAVEQKTGTLVLLTPKTSRPQRLEGGKPDQVRRVLALGSLGPAAPIASVSTVAGRDQSYTTVLEGWSNIGKTRIDQRKLDVGDRIVTAAAFSPDGSEFALAARKTGNGAVKDELLFFTAEAATPTTIVLLPSYTSKLVISKNGERIAAAGHGDGVVIIDMREHKIVKEFALGATDNGDVEVAALGISNDGRFVAAASSFSRSNLRVWDTLSDWWADPDKQSTARAKPVSWLSLPSLEEESLTIVVPRSSSVIEAISLAKPARPGP